MWNGKSKWKFFRTNSVSLSLFFFSLSYGPVCNTYAVWRMSHTEWTCMGSVWSNFFNEFKDKHMSLFVLRETKKRKTINKPYFLGTMPKRVKEWEPAMCWGKSGCYKIWKYITFASATYEYFFKNIRSTNILNSNIFGSFLPHTFKYKDSKEWK